MPNQNEDVFSIFKSQVTGYLRNITDAILKLEKDPDNMETYKALMRDSHTLKGAARAMQFISIKELSHALEGLFNNVQLKKIKINPSVINEILAAIDLIKKMLDQKEIKTSKEKPKEIVSMIERLSLIQTAGSESAQLPVVDAAADAPKKEEHDTVSKTDLTFQVHASVLDRMLEYSGVLKVTQQLSHEISGRFKSYLEKVMKLGSLLSSGTPGNEVERIRRIQKELQESLSEGMRDMEHLTTQLFHTNTELDEEIVNARLKTLDEMFSQFPRMVRDLAQEHNKDVNIEIAGKDVKIDNAVLNVIKTPMMHLLRNAVGHGIEPNNIRTGKNKSKAGKITVSARQAEGQVIIDVTDDGAGIDIDVIRHQVVALGNLTEETAGRLSKEELIQFLFLPGFTTITQLTDLSGRGIGLDVVKTEVESIGGHVTIHSEKDKFTTFSLRFPITISLTPSLVVVGGVAPLFGRQCYILPVNQIVSLHLVNPENIFNVEDRQMIELNGQTIPLCQLSVLFGLKETQLRQEKKNIVILGAAGRYGALMVEEILHEESVVVKPFDSRIGKVQDIAGTATLKNGVGVLMLDTHDLINTIQEMSHVNRQVYAEEKKEASSSKSILVVEDSATVRELMKHVLTSNGYNVQVAVDGQDGLNKFEQYPFDLLISDIDMPRMNGFDMLKNIRQAKKNADIPVIMLSYKERDQDKNMAFSIGANEYLTKADFDKGVIIKAVERFLKGKSKEDGPICF